MHNLLVHVFLPEMTTLWTLQLLRLQQALIVRLVLRVLLVASYQTSRVL